MDAIDKKVLALVPARGGSKGLPRKNILPVGGCPLIGWTIDAALKSKHVTKLILSSDDAEIMAVAADLGCDVPFRRPSPLSSDTASTMDVVFHALSYFPGYEFILLLQPTSPLRNEFDIDSAFSLMVESGAPACVSVSPVNETPYWMYTLSDDCRLLNVAPPPENAVRRQDLPDVYSLNGAIYIARVDWLQTTRSFVTPETVAYTMPRERSLDIDTAEDFEAFRSLVE